MPSESLTLQVIDDAEHARLPPSGAGRWTECTASIGYVEANDKLLPDGGSTYADAGTRAHTAGAALILDPAAKVETDDAETLRNVTAYAEFCRSKKQYSDRMVVEKRVQLFYLPSQKGTLDFGIHGPNGIYIVDYKNGAGVPVYAKENKQLASYAESWIRELEMIYDFDDKMLVTLVIYQPNDRSDDNPVRIWAISRGALRTFCEEQIQPAANLILNTPEKAVFRAGEHCDKGFCRARGICDAYAARGLMAIPSHEQGNYTPALPSPSSLTREQRVKVINSRKALESWLEKVEDQEVAELLGGAAPMGLKLVEGKSNRGWKDEMAVEKLLSTVLPPEVIRPVGSIFSVAEAYKHTQVKVLAATPGRAAEFAALIVKPKGKPSLVPESDKRPTLVLNPAEGLENLDLPDANDLV